MPTKEHDQPWWQKSLFFARSKLEEIRQKRKEDWHDEARLLWEKWRTDPLFLLGIGLYWGEGSKSSKCPSLRLSNSDVTLQRIWLDWCRRFLPGVPLASALNLHPNCDPEAARRFWEEQLDIKIGYVWVSVSSASKRSRNTLPNGTLNIRVGRGSLEWYTKMMVWLELAQDLPFTAATRAEIPSGHPNMRFEEEAIRRQHAATPIRQRPAGVIHQQSFVSILRLLARFKALRESQGLTLSEVAERMGIDAPALSRLETGKVLNPTLATLHKWAEALGQKLDVDLSSP